MAEVLEAGGQFVMRDFHSPAEYATLKEKVVINSTGFAAKQLWNDKTMIPVRGQTAWLRPQPEAKYGVNYAGVSLLSKSDGVMMMNPPQKEGEMYGVNDSNEIPDRQQILDGIAAIAPLFAKKAPQA